MFCTEENKFIVVKKIIKKNYSNELELWCYCSVVNFICLLAYIFENLLLHLNCTTILYINTTFVYILIQSIAFLIIIIDCGKSKRVFNV